MKGLHKKARRGEIANFTGISSQYEAPEIVVNTHEQTAEDAADFIVARLKVLGLVE